MKRLVLIAACIASIFTASAEDKGFYGNKIWDNWYVGINGGVGTTTTHQALLKNVNPNAGIRVGKWLTPYFGLAAEGNAFFSNKFRGENINDTKVVRNIQVNILGQFNLQNIIWGYEGAPRKFEILPLVGIGWGHNFGGGNPDGELGGALGEGTRLNTLNTKFGIDFAYNFGKKMEWQAYIEPSINYAISGVDEDTYKLGKDQVKFNSNASWLMLNVGIVYKFKTSNGQHNFMLNEGCDENLINDLNANINALRSNEAAQKDRIAKLQKENETLRNALKECEEKPAPVEVAKEPEMPNLTPVFYKINKSIITEAQVQNVEIAAEILKKHPEFKLLIKGYASPEGPHDNNTSLGVRRANAVKTMLINKYGISADRITAEGCGETDKLFEIYEFNRVAMMYLAK